MKVRQNLTARHFWDVNPVLPAVIAATGIVLVGAGRPFVGVGLIAGALLAFLNSWLLVKRIDLAAATGNAPAAMVSMQLGLLVTFTVVGGMTVGMIFVSRTMTIIMAITFFVTQTLELLLYYWARRSRMGSLNSENLQENRT